MYVPYFDRWATFVVSPHATNPPWLRFLDDGIEAVASCVCLLENTTLRAS